MIDSWGGDAWSPEALLDTLQQFLGVGLNDDLSDEIRFLGGVATLIRKRLVRGELNQSPRRPAVFFLHPEPLDVSSADKGQFFPMLDNGLDPVSGRLWFLNKVVNCGTAIEVQSDNDASLFNLVVKELGVGEIPAVILDTRTPEPEARYYPKGLGSPGQCRLVRIDVAHVSVNDVFEVIDRVYEQQLCTPDVQGNGGKLWEGDSTRGWAVKNAEDKVSVVIRSGLSGHFIGCFIEAEQVQPEGRLDILIKEPSLNDRAQQTLHAVLELKVLRGKNSSGASVPDSYNKDWVEKGVLQASEYRRGNGARLAALCCFDMRSTPSGQDCFQHVQELAERLDVRVKCWHLFSSSENYRRYKATVALSNTGS
ncbi:hypothetical protein [Micromonospora sp. NPDC092111]|uniref:hypothetical protein n=1 Tax=Micromonospora sp. NPDC092111 TaxID=3364289 RepID=UPI00382FA086